MSQNFNFHFFDLKMIIVRSLVKLWSCKLDQIDPYNVPELFRGVPRLKNISKKYKKVIKKTLHKMGKRIFLKSARTKTIDSIESEDSHYSIKNIGSIDCIDSIEFYRV